MHTTGARVVSFCQTENREGQHYTSMLRWRFIDILYIQQVLTIAIQLRGTELA